MALIFQTTDPEGENYMQSNEANDGPREDGFERRTKEKEGKVPLSLIPTFPLMEIGRVLQYGSQKYEPNLWRTQPMSHRHRVDAVMRHLLVFNEGEDLDPESGLSHLAHALCQLMFLVETAKTHPELDDRWNYRHARSHVPVEEQHHV